MMKKNRLLLLALLLTSCSTKLNYDLAYRALDELESKVSYFKTIEVKHATYHPYEEERNFDELVIINYFYDEGSINDLEDYLMYSYNKELDSYTFIQGEEAEMYFYYSTGIDNPNYKALDINKLKKYIEEK